MTRVADSSFLIALFDGTDPRRDSARAVAAEAEAILVPPEVLAETLGVVHVRRGFDASVQIWKGLKAIPHLIIAPPAEPDTVAAIFLAERGNLSWVDATVVAHCRASGASPLCYDPAIDAALRR